MGQEEGRRKKSSYKETMLKSRGCSKKKKEKNTLGRAGQARKKNYRKPTLDPQSLEAEQMSVKP